MKQASLTKLRQNLSGFLNAVNNDNEPLVVTRRRGNPVVVISLEDYETMSQITDHAHECASTGRAKRLLNSFIEVDEITFLPMAPTGSGKTEV